MLHEWLHQNSCNTVFPRDMVFLRNVSVDTLHKVDTEGNNNNNNNNNNSATEDQTHGHCTRHS